LPSLLKKRALHRSSLFSRALIIFLFCSVTLHAQFQRYRNYSSKDGLPSSEVYEMIQDSSGYMWFATDMGVSRFSGYEFKNYTTENGLADNTVFGIHQDYKGRIWFRSASKLSYFENGAVHSLPFNSALDVLVNRTSISSIYVDEKDTIWLATQTTGIVKISPPWTAQSPLVVFNADAGGYLMEIDKNGFICGGTNNTYCDLHLYSKFKKTGVIPLGLKNEFQNPVRYQAIRLKDQSYFVTANNILVTFKDANLHTRKVIDVPVINSIQDNDGKIYLSTYYGVYYFEDSQLAHLKKIKDFNRKIITRLLRDRENELWICTKGHGVYAMPYRNLSYYTPQNGLSESTISCMATCGDKVIAGHLNGSISILFKDSIRNIELEKQSDPTSKINEVTGFLNFNDAIYVSTIKKTYRLNKETFKIESAIPESGTKQLVAGSDESVWSLRFRNVVKYKNIENEKVKTIFRTPSFSDFMFEDRKGKLWICCSNGLWSYTPTTGLFDEGKNNKLFSARFVEIQEASDGTLWMASRGEGVVVVKGNKTFQIKQENGLSNNMCKTLLVDKNNVVWVGTNSGLNKITLTDQANFKYRVNTYFSKNGLLTNEVNKILLHENKLWIAHNNGISVFDPKAIQDNSNPPPVYITQTLVNEEAISPATLPALNHHQNYLNISFIGLSLKDPANLEYKYKMEGIDPEWIYTSYTNIKYPALPAGTYRFLVSAKNNDGYWSKNPAVLSFTIHPAWWQTWWFKIVCGILLIGIIYIIFRHRLALIERRERLRSIQQSRMAAAELKALRAQMNPHFVYNAINSVQYFITNNDPQSSQKYLSKFAKLIRYVVDNSKPAAIPLEKEIEALCFYLDLESLRFEKKFEYNIHIHPAVDSGFLQIPSMLIQPYVENAIWHGLMHKQSPGKISIRFEMSGKVLQCIIEDNGIGRKKSRELNSQNNANHKSVGMSITRERLEIFNQLNRSNLSVNIMDLMNSDGSTGGTRVELNIPYF
jgi:ligand-binding sensor domain-containing protein